MGTSDRARCFDAAAGAYDGGRPGYPEAMIDDCVRIAGLGPGARILEVGCGTGQATLPFARRGFRITCLEPGPNLAALARRNLSGFPAVEVLETTLEDWTVEPGAFDLVLAAASLHHVDPAARYAKPAAALKPSGFLADAGNNPGEDDRSFRAELDRIYAKWWGEESAREYAAMNLARRIGARKLEIGNSGFFEPVEVLQYPWTVGYDAARYMMLLDSDSGRIQHPPEAQAGLKADIAAAIERRGGKAVRGYVAVLVLARPARPEE